jgi:hypothetical protein
MGRSIGNLRGLGMCNTHLTGMHPSSCFEPARNALDELLGISSSFFRIFAFPACLSHASRTFHPCLYSLSLKRGCATISLITSDDFPRISVDRPAKDLVLFQLKFRYRKRNLKSLSHDCCCERRRSASELRLPPQMIIF